MALQKVKTMAELATLSGISRPSLSKYFNDPNSVRDSTRARILRALEQYDYVPNIYAVNQNRSLTRNIGIVVPYLSDPFFAEVSRNLEPKCAQAGFNPILLSSFGEPERESENLQSLRAIKPAGVLLAPLGERSDREAMRAFAKDIPTVLFDCEIAGMGEAHFGSNNAQSIGTMVEYLCRTGEPPAFFEMKDAPNPNAVQRRKAYCAAMERLGKEPMVLCIEGQGWEFERIAFRAGERLINGGLLPTDTVLCSNDRLAIGLLAVAFELGLKVGTGRGASLRIAGHDDHPFSRFTCPALTTMSQSYDEIASATLNCLLDIVDSGERPEERHVTLFDGTLKLRRSA
ncbi:MAG: LacI family DNA-binding transcriptional regulator [Pseudomonadota bacterium]